MKTQRIFTSAALLISVICLISCNSKNDFRRISVEEYQSKMKAGWLGQMAGVGWGAPTEFKFNGIIIPEEKVPEWKRFEEINPTVCVENIPLL